MSAGSIPYHLRPNKAVDRLLFIELLERLNATLGIDNRYTYTGFGGPQMEDFRVLHERFPTMKMFCIEASAPVIARQMFNRPHTLVEIGKLPMKSGAWLADWCPEEPAIVWLDYAIKKERTEQFREFQNLLRRAHFGSILRVTMNADLPRSEDPRKPDEQLALAKKAFPQLLPGGLKSNDMTSINFPKVLLSMFKIAADDVLKSWPERAFQPLLITTYKDTNQMIVLTGMLDTPEQCAKIAVDSSLKAWPYNCVQWDSLKRINMPALTVKERIHINEKLPDLTVQPKQIQDALGFWLAERETESLDKLKNYIEFYRQCPQFVRAAF